LRCDARHVCGPRTNPVFAFAVSTCKVCSVPETGHAPVAQRIEHLTTDEKVWGSNPYGRTTSLAMRHPCPPGPGPIGPLPDTVRTLTRRQLVSKPAGQTCAAAADLKGKADFDG